ncbi:MAG: hypothetical protein ACTHMD_04885 [Flavisolibacter sp.]
MKIFLIIGGIFIIIFICFVPLKRDIAEYNTQKNGELITGVITDVPNCIGTKVKQFIKFRFSNSIYSKRIGAPCEQYKIGQKIQLKHTPGTDLFLYVNETKEREFISTGLLAVAGLAFIVIGFKKK